MPDPLKKQGGDSSAGVVVDRVTSWLKGIDPNAWLSAIRFKFGRTLTMKRNRGPELDAKSQSRLRGPVAAGRDLSRELRSAATDLSECVRRWGPVARSMELLRNVPGVPEPVARLLRNSYVRRASAFMHDHRLAVLFVGLCILPYLLSYSQQEIAVFLVINVLLVSSYRLLTLTGEWSLGHAVMMGVGAYASALFAKKLGVPVPISMLIGASVAGIAAFVLSYPLLRMKGFYFLIGSFAAGEIIRLIWKRFTTPFGGPKGIKRIDPFPDIEVGFVNIDFYEPVNYYFFCLIVVSASLFFLYRVEQSRFGLTFHSIHWGDKLAESVGVNIFRYRMLAFVIASFFAGLAGALYAHYVGTVNPNRFGVDQMVFVLVWAIVGGTATFYGPILGVVVLTVINEMVLRGLGLDTVRPMIYGAILIASVLFLPMGLESLIPKIRNWFNGGEAGKKRAVSASIVGTAEAMTDVKPQDRQVANIADTAFAPWLDDDGRPTGMSTLQLGENYQQGVGFHLFRMEPGAVSTAHEHTEHEEFYVVDGELIDHDGTVYRTGDLVWLRKGTQHSSTSPDGCLLAVYIGRQEINLPSEDTE